VCGILYLHDISCQWITPIMRLDFQVLTKACGPEALNQGFVKFVTTKWEEVPESRGLARQKEVEEAMWASLGAKGARLLSAEDAQQLVEETVSRMCIDHAHGGLLLQIQNELAKPGVGWMGTAAGRCLLSATQPQPRRKGRTGKAGAIQAVTDDPAEEVLSARRLAIMPPTSGESSQDTKRRKIRRLLRVGISQASDHYWKDWNFRLRRTRCMTNILDGAREGEYVILYVMPSYRRHSLPDTFFPGPLVPMSQAKARCVLPVPRPP
jgi:hypothetical protein